MTLFSIEPSPMVIVGPFPVNYNDSNVLTTGVELWTPEAGYVIYNMWFETPTPFAGTDWIYSQIEIKTPNDVLIDPAVHLLYVGAQADTGIDVAELWPSDVLGVQTYMFGSAHWFPARMKNTVPILLKLHPIEGDYTPGGTMTAGVLHVYALVGEPA